MFKPSNFRDELCHVHFYLKIVRRAWLKNCEFTIPTRNNIYSKFLHTFTSVTQNEEAATSLETRMPLLNENVAIFAEETARLFRHADPNTPEQKKIRFLMRGVKPEHFTGFMRNPPKTILEFLLEAEVIEKMLEMRTHQCNHRSSKDSVAVQARCFEDLREMTCD